MHELIAFIGQCFASGMLLRSTCVLFVIPIVAWLVVRALLPLIERLDGDPGSQAPLAAIAAIIPGGLLLALSMFGLITSFKSPCLQTPAGQVLFGITAALVSLATARATLLARRRSAEARMLVSQSRAARGRLADLARELDIHVGVLDESTPFCALTGTIRPVVLVSSGALERLTDSELQATLLHERGHARRGDQAVAAILAFMVDLLPLPAPRFVALYRQARELAADDHALRQVAAYDLAAALLTFLSASRSVPTMASIGDHGRLRLERLLLGTRAPLRAGKLRVAVAFALGLTVVGGIAPALAELQSLSCFTMNATMQAR